MTDFKNRVFGCVIVKAINANYNADFSGQPRRLPNGVVYATDKAIKYSIKNYIKSCYSEKNVFSMKTLDENFSSRDLVQTYKKHFNSEVKDDSLQKILKNLLSRIDLRLFGMTFAPKGSANQGKNLSLHGPVQVNHAVNIWKDNYSYTEQIMSPFKNGDGSENSEDDNNATTLGRQSRLEEGHYLHHFSINPHNLDELQSLAPKGTATLSCDDIKVLKEAMKRGVTYYDSASKAGCENEVMVWVQLKEGSKNVIPSLTTLIKLLPEKKDGKCVYDFATLKDQLNNDNIKNDIESVTISFNKNSCEIANVGDGWKKEEYL